MRNVKRTAEPPALSKNAKKWKKKLLDELKKEGRAPESMYDRYSHEDVKIGIRIFGEEYWMEGDEQKKTTSYGERKEEVSD